MKTRQRAPGPASLASIIRSNGRVATFLADGSGGEHIAPAVVKEKVLAWFGL
jgi:hypothetical protein